jgi:hypothetical protein
MLTGVEVETRPRYVDHPRVAGHVERLQAWRLWAVEDVAGAARLRSLYRSCVWPVGVPVVAQCDAQRSRLWGRSPHESPVDTCSCGVYAVGADRIRRLWRDCESPPRFSLVIGSVALWGGVVECEHGWRARLAYPSTIFVPAFALDPDETAARLAEYGVPVEMLDACTIGMALDTVAERAV